MTSVKSNLLLGGSCVAAIAAVGCVFELAYGQPQLGTTLTLAILAISIPATVGFFVAAVREAKAS
ncbi:MAG: hypothetical protein AAFY57_15440, partial [Cyanobacteria bacterium J06642_2]